MYNKKAVKIWEERHQGNIEYWEGYITFGIEDVIEIEQITAEIEYKEKLEKDEAFRKEEETKANIEAWDDIQFDIFHLNLIQYKKTYSNEDFNKIWNQLKKINRQMAAKY